MLNSINPSNGELIASYEEMTKEEVKVIISDVNSAYQKWRLTSFSHRAQLMKNAAEILQDRKEDLGRLMTFEMGKPFSQAVAEANKCASVCEYYANNAEKILENQIIERMHQKAMLPIDPLALSLVQLCLWNFPFWQVLRFAAPALMAGNVGVLKHASNVQGCALEIEKIFQDAGFPMNVFSNIGHWFERCERSD